MLVHKETDRWFSAAKCALDEFAGQNQETI